MRLIATLAVAVATGIAGLVPGPGFATRAFAVTGAGFVGVAVLLWVILGARDMKPGIGAIKRHAPSLLLAVACTAFVFWCNPPRLKVFYDEAMLAAVARGLAETGTAYPAMEFDPGGFTFATSVDKRPLLHPFLVGLAHLATGARVENVYPVNAFAALAALASLYLLLARWTGRWCAAAVIPLAAGMPVFRFWVTSGGFEALNLCFIALSGLFLARCAEQPTTRRAEILFLSLILASQCRYESVVLWIGVLPLLPRLVRQGIFRQSQLIPALPVLLLPVLWQRRAWMLDQFSSQIEFMPVGDPRTATFSLANGVANLMPNLDVLLGFSPEYGYTPVVSVLALLGLYAMLRQILGPGRGEREKALAILMGGAGLAGAALAAVVFSYLGGRLTAPESNRIGLAFLPFLVVPAVFALHGIVALAPPSFRWLALACAALHLAAWSPLATAERIPRWLNLQYEADRVLRFVERRTPTGRVLLVVDNPILYAIRDRWAIGFAAARERSRELAGRVRSGEIVAVLVLQRVSLLNGGVYVRSALWPGAEVEEVGRIGLSRLSEMRVSAVHY